MSTFLVTGGTGRIGTECIAQLASQGHRVKFATRNPGGATAQFREKFGPGTVRAVGMDVNDAASIDKALEDCTGALFISPIDESWHEQIAAQMKQSSLAFCVKVSVTGARGPDSDPPPGRLPSIHWRGEEHFRNSGVPTTCIRPTIFAQHFLGLNKVLFQTGDEAIHLPTGDTQVAFLDCRDIAHAATALLTNSKHQAQFANQSFELTGSTAVSGSEIAQILSDVSGRMIRHVDGADAYSAHAAQLGESDWGKVIYKEAEDGWFSDVHDDEFQTLLGRHTNSFAKFAYDHRHAF